MPLRLKYCYCLFELPADAPGFVDGGLEELLKFIQAAEPLLDECS
ncbi:MAG: hypothetical protein O2968_21620 [Acidobacteria bacterium]|nr:hypothetical protein [Acidobacteriota bacterium]